MSLSSKAQQNFDVGCVFGLTYYKGDLNPSKQFYKPNFMYGCLCRYNINETYSIRGNVLFGGIEADDSDFLNAYQKDRDLRFRNKYINLSVLLEYNFYPFWLPKQSWSNFVVPFISAGGGYVFSNVSTFTIPMTIGVKSLCFKYITLAAEWSFIKTFSDNLDGVADPINTGVSSNLINNDWIAYGGISITYRFAADKSCSLYNKMRSNGVRSRRR
jgi:hypothetical protein